MWCDSLGVDKKDMEDFTPCKSPFKARKSSAQGREDMRCVSSAAWKFSKEAMEKRVTTNDVMEEGAGDDSEHGTVNCHVSLGR
jgi:hypothetical protein